MFTNDIKKGQRVRLACGWFATIMDNKKGDIRFAEVEGFYTELGSVYSHDIVAVQLSDGSWERVTHTAKQKALKATVDSW